MRVALWIRVLPEPTVRWISVENAPTIADDRCTLRQPLTDKRRFGGKQHAA